MSGFTIKLPEGYHELNTPARGYLEDVEVTLGDGRACMLTFVDPHNEEHYLFYFEGQTVIVVPEVSERGIEEAVSRMLADGSLDQLSRAPHADGLP